MFSSDRRYFSGFMATALTLLTVTEGQALAQTSGELNPRATAIVFVTDATPQETSDTEISFESFQPLWPGSFGGTSTPRHSLGDAADWEVPRPLSKAIRNVSLRVRQQPGPQKRSWIERHPALFGAVVGFGSGFLIGYMPGDDGVFDDFTAGFNGWVIGGVGAATGAAVGAIVGALTK